MGTGRKSNENDVIGREQNSQVTKQRKFCLPKKEMRRIGKERK